MPVDHYENFPVASIVLPKKLRRPIEAIYQFARSADDIADEGNATDNERLQALAAYRGELDRIERGEPTTTAPFSSLAETIAEWQLPIILFRDLLDAFSQDVVKKRYTDYEELLDYCRRSANPVGRLLLHLYGVHTPQALEQSDAICTALQLINFWQDLSVDVPRGRFYLTDADCAAHGVQRADLLALRSTPNTTQLIASSAHWARASMLKGAPLVHLLPGRAGWELRLVVQGGLRILDKVDALRGGSLHTRPCIRAWDAPLMLLRALTM